ncbi:glycoside hydrolase family 2 [Antarcticibacterium flavum]|uniref:Glycoside hydrolase family 2 n=1 Tax=Antarcticibacterium flavum TaxID=2058175 RepID=A0A5B7X0K9_9FLAO|nr:MULTISPECIES: glycoside hydrolase family 2 TIM barrel-domain containing protein [Antarcticibacterium]MCM4159868.1 glycoside hydrolase family 2 [Antarcticibacterium sp. W02-3]QCY68869.1 glycoside hydrolase family 2 [Antarcticibacterium flavum]
MKYSFIILTFLFSLTSVAQRQVQTINAAWEFILEEDNKAQIVNIPHTWNAEDAFRDGKEYFRGKGTYLKNIFVPQEWEQKRAFLKFEGSNQITTVFVNGKKIGEHRGGYTGFVFDVSEALNFGQANELKIEVDNSHNPDIPPLDADFNFYGGIYRDLELILTNAVHFELENEAAGNLLIKTGNVSAESASIDFEARIVNAADKRRRVKLEVNIFDPENKRIRTITRELNIRPGASNKVNITDKLQNPALWSPDAPNLYKLEARLVDRASGEVLDDFDSKFGLRWFEVDTERGFILNGEPIKLIGANRHQDFEGLGNALPNSLHRKDYEMMKEMGSNVIRTAHYPQDPEVYRLCDELGLLVWTEVPVINDVTDTDAYHDISLKMQREQILQFYNHPSIVMWGIMNEIFIRLVFNNQITEEEKVEKIRTSVELAEKLEKETKRLDPQRLSVMALHENELYNESGIADITDVIGWNLYFGWYSPGLESFGEFLDEQHKRYPDRPLFISEYGPGADVRLQTDTPLPWDYSEAYQLELHRSYINQVLERDFVFGMTAWNFADFGSSFRQDAAPYINQKGLVNIDRSKKDIFYYYQARLLEEPVLYITGEHYKTRYPKDENEEITITVFSNASEVTLNVDDREFSETVEDGIAVFNLLLPEGKHRITAKTDDLTHTRDIEVKFRKNMLKNLEKEPILLNVGAKVNYTDPVTGETWISDQEYSEGEFGYVGGEVYQKNKSKFQGTASDIQGTENDPLFQTMREGIEAYKFDVPAGNYRVTLLFSEPEFNASEENIYNLSEAQKQEISGLRSFDVRINGNLFSKDLNLARDYGRIRAVEKSYRIKAGDNGIQVEFEENSGKSVLSGIRLEKI